MISLPSHPHLPQGHLKSDHTSIKLVVSWWMGQFSPVNEWNGLRPSMSRVLSHTQLTIPVTLLRKRFRHFRNGKGFPWCFPPEKMEILIIANGIIRRLMCLLQQGSRLGAHLAQFYGDGNEKTEWIPGASRVLRYSASSACPNCSATCKGVSLSRVRRPAHLMAEHDYLFPSVMKHGEFNGALKKSMEL